MTQHPGFKTSEMSGQERCVPTSTRKGNLHNQFFFQLIFEFLKQNYHLISSSNIGVLP